jgi:hypothetical protein
MIPPVLVLAQLYAVRALVAGLIAALEEVEVAEAAQPATNGCQHPAGRQVDATTLSGPPQVVCLDCGQQRAGTVEG